MNKVGSYRGVEWKQQRICDVLAVSIKARWFFVYVDGDETGDHFRTMRDLYAGIDEMIAKGEL